ncbi:hypothetical protein Q3G72_022069 [Acer saccharum]|nr:hypothetical protein Q3G72_022069 [Acer saccharum]
MPISFKLLKDFLGLKVEDSRMFLNLLRSKVGLGSEGLFCREERLLVMDKDKGQLMGDSKVIAKKTNIKKRKASCSRGVNSLAGLNRSADSKGLVFGLIELNFHKNSKVKGVGKDGEVLDKGVASLAKGVGKHGVVFDKCVASLIGCLDRNHRIDNRNVKV